MQKVVVARPALEKIEFIPSANGKSSMQLFKVGEFSGRLGVMLRENDQQFPNYLQGHRTTVFFDTAGSSKEIKVPVRIGAACMNPKEEAIYQAVQQFTGREL